MSEFNTTLEQAKKLVSKGRMSRRDIVQLALATGVTAVAADKLFVTAARAEPKKGGTFKTGIGHADVASNRQLDSQRIAGRWWFV